MNVITKWKTGTLARGLIEEVQVARETDSSVFVLTQGFHAKNERREAKQTDYHAYHDTWEEAKAHLFQKAEAAVLSAQSALQRRRDELGNIKGLRKPPTPSDNRKVGMDAGVQG